MRDDVQHLLEDPSSGLWVGIDVVCEALDVRERRARQLAISEGWRIVPAYRGRPRQYYFPDIARTWRQRKDRPQ